MNGLITAVNQSILTRLLANIFLFLVLLACLAIAVLQVIGIVHVSLSGIDPALLTILGAGVGQAIHLLGLNVGLTLIPIQSIQTSTKVEESK